MKENEFNSEKSNFEINIEGKKANKENYNNDIITEIENEIETGNLKEITEINEINTIQTIVQKEVESETDFIEELRTTARANRI